MCDATTAARKRWRSIVACLVLVVTVVAGCSGPDEAATEPALAPSASATLIPATPTATAPPTALPPTAPPPAGQSCAPGVDILGFSDALDETVADDVPVGGISALAWTGGDEYLGLSDRDGVVYRITFPLDGAPRADGMFRLSDALGENYGEDAIDGEGLALDGDDLLVASEVGPEVNRYSADGRLLGMLSVPPRFLVAPNGQGTPNETFESLALGLDGASLWTANEQPLAGDGVDADGRGRVRLLRYQRDGDSFVPAGEFVYLTEPDQGLVELVALPGGDLLALERGLSLAAGFTARVYRVTVGDATDASAIDALDGANVVPVTKELLADLDECPVTPGGGLPGPFSPLLDNFEGMTFGPDLPDGRRSLLLVSDDNGLSLQVTRIIVLAVDPARLR